MTEHMAYNQIHRIQFRAGFEVWILSRVLKWGWLFIFEIEFRFRAAFALRTAKDGNTAELTSHRTRINPGNC